MKNLSKAIAVASLLSAGVMTSQAANAEVEYSAQLDSMYLYRGENIGGSLISASIDYSHESGLYAGAWIASAPETDLYVGYYMEAGEVELDVSLATYAYGGDADPDSAETFGKDVEAVVSVSAMGANVTYTLGLQDLEDTSHLSLGYEIGGVALAYGMADYDTDGKYSHFDASVGLTEELSLTVSQAMDDTYGINEDTIFMVSYTLPIK